MPKWIHDRAAYLQSKNPDMPESEAWAIATQQSHALGKSPKSYGTSEGKLVAKSKYPTPKDDKKTANPDAHKRVKMAAFISELGRIAVEEGQKEAAVSPRVSTALALSGLGAGVGAGAGYLGTKVVEPVDTEDSKAGRNALIGGLSGAVLGGGAGMLLPASKPAASVLRTTSDVALGREALRDEVTGAGEALDLLRGSPTVAETAFGLEHVPAALELGRKIKRLKGTFPHSQLIEPSVRMRTGRNPGHIARLNMRRRRTLAANLDLPPSIIEAAGQGKYGAAISEQEAIEALDRYQQLRDQSPTASQVGRYAAVGAAAAPVAGVLRNAIAGGSALSGAKDKLVQDYAKRLGKPGPALAHARSLAGMATAGALTSGAIPLVRSYLDQQAEKKKLKSFLQQSYIGEKVAAVGPEAGFSESEYSTPIEGPKRARQASYIPPGHKVAGVGPEAGFSSSGYGDTGGFVDFHQVSSQPGMQQQDLRSRAFSSPTGGRVGAGSLIIPTVKTASPPMMGALSASSLVGKTPGALQSRGPSIAQLAKPKGFGLPAPGATKTSIH